MIELYLVRHGETDFNRRKVYYGFSDPDLNVIGEKQCQDLFYALKEVDFDVIISSTLKRAINSAEIISGKGKSDILAIEDLKEVNFGKWEDKTYAEIQEEYREECSLWGEDWINFSFPEGERFTAFFERVRLALEGILKEYADKKILLVAHDGSLKIMALILLNMNIEDYWRLNFEFGCYSKFDIQSNFALLRKINCR